MLNLTASVKQKTAVLGGLSAVLGGFVLIWKQDELKTRFRPLKAMKKVRRRFKRFSDFASLQINGEPYMTPQDYLDHIIYEHPKPRITRKVCPV